MAEEQLLGGLPLGEVAHSRARTITDGEFGLLTSLTWTIGPMHVDEEHMKTTPFGRRILGGPVVAAVVSGLWYTSCWDDFQRTVPASSPSPPWGLRRVTGGPSSQTTPSERRRPSSRPGRRAASPGAGSCLRGPRL